MAAFGSLSLFNGRFQAGRGKAGSDRRQPARTPRKLYGKASTSRADSGRNDFASLRRTADFLRHELASLRFTADSLRHAVDSLRFPADSLNHGAGSLRLPAHSLSHKVWSLRLTADFSAS